MQENTCPPQLIWKLEKIGKSVIFGLAFSAFFIPLANYANAEIIPAARKIDWSQVGVNGDIPTNRPSCNVTINAATHGNGITDATTVIQNALNSCSGKVVNLPTGTYKISNGIIVPSNTTLRGEGIGKTILKNSDYITYLIGFDNNPDVSFSSATAFNITAGNTKGSTSITVDTSSGSLNWSVGDLILIDQLEDPAGTPAISSTGTGGSKCTWCSRASGSRPAGQIAKIIAIVGNVATLELPLTKTYDKSPQAIKLNGVTSNAGIENLSLDSSAACTNDNYGIISDIFSENSWILNTEVLDICRTGIQLSNVYRNTVRGSVIHETEHHYSNGGYLMWLAQAASANLIENNNFHNGLDGVILDGAISGNVIAYNYFTHFWNSDYAGKTSAGISVHGAEPMMNLMEGNELDGASIIMDSYWGYAAYNTFFRNHQTTSTYPYAPVNQLYGVQLFTNSWYMNFVGNVLGTSGTETAYQSSDIWDGRHGIFYLDTNIAASTLRHGNWVSMNASGQQNATVWDATISDHILPSSMYLAAKPAWWGIGAWPAIGSDLGTMVNEIPAKKLVTDYEPMQGSGGSDTCTTLNFVSGSASPTTVDVNGTYNVSCNYGIAGIDSVNASSDLGICTYTGWSGTAALFQCSAGSAGIRTNRCWIEAGTSSDSCAKTNDINSVTVGTGKIWSISDITVLVRDWYKKVLCPSDADSDGVVSVKDLGIMMSGW